MQLRHSSNSKSSFLSLLGMEQPAIQLNDIILNCCPFWLSTVLNQQTLQSSSGLWKQMESRDFPCAFHPLSQHPHHSFPPFPSVINTVHWCSTYVPIHESMLFPDSSLKSTCHIGISPLYFRTTVSVSPGNVFRSFLQETKVLEYGCSRPLYSMMQYFHTTYTIFPHIYKPSHLWFTSSTQQNTNTM